MNCDTDKHTYAPCGEQHVVYTCLRDGCYQLKVKGVLKHVLILMDDVFVCIYSRTLHLFNTNLPSIVRDGERETRFALVDTIE